MHTTKILSLVLAVGFLAGCKTTEQASLKQSHDEAARKVAHMEDEPITRLSFVPIVGDEAFDIVVDTNAAAASDIMPAAGEENGE